MQWANMATMMVSFPSTSPVLIQSLRPSGRHKTSLHFTGLGNTALAVFGIHTERLVMLKKQYDPNNVFRKWIDLLAPTPISVQ
jgi:hypothetical protein